MPTEPWSLEGNRGDAAHADMHVTIAMAVHNETATLEAALQSVLSQEYKDWDMVIVDDASEEPTVRILKSYAARHDRITLLRNETNRGLAASLNTAWRAAKGPLIARMDADDVCVPGRLRLQAQFLAAHPEVSVLGGGAELCDDAGRFLGIARRPADHERLVERIFRENPFIHSSVMMRRGYLQEAGGYDEGLRRAQDYDLWLRSYGNFRFHNLQEPLIRYRVRRSGLSYEAIFYGAFVVSRAARRDGRFFEGLRTALRFTAANLLTRAGLYESRLR